MLLPRKVVERLRPHSRGERLILLGWFFFVNKQVHGEYYTKDLVGRVKNVPENAV